MRCSAYNVHCSLRPARSLNRPRRPFYPECFSPFRFLLEPLRLLPAGGTVAGRGYNPRGTTRNQRLSTAHLISYVRHGLRRLWPHSRLSFGGSSVSSTRTDISEPLPERVYRVDQQHLRHLAGGGPAHRCLTQGCAGAVACFIVNRAVSYEQGPSSHERCRAVGFSVLENSGGARRYSLLGRKAGHEG